MRCRLYHFHDFTHSTNCMPPRTSAPNEIPPINHGVIGILEEACLTKQKTNDELSLHSINVIPVTWYAFNYSSVIFSSYGWKLLISTASRSPICSCKLYVLLSPRCWITNSDCSSSFNAFFYFFFFFLFRFLFSFPLQFSLLFFFSCPKLLSFVLHFLESFARIPSNIVNSLYTWRRE